jgi:photosystem II stability/assembly factor-like uncharacterized protein
VYRADGSLLFTTDGGFNWDNTFIAGKPTVYPYDFYKIYFFNNEEGIAINLARPWFTNNGGKSWTAGDSSDVYLYPWDITFASRNKGWIVSEATPYSTDAGYIANTTDGGKTWKYQDSITSKLLAVDFINSIYGFAVGTNWNNSTGFVYSTADGGNSWIWEQFIGLGAFWDIGFLDDKNGWITGDGKILNTTDGGNTWGTQVLGLQYVIRKLIVLKNERVAYAFGDYFYGPPFTLLFTDLNNIAAANNENLPNSFQLMQNYPNPFNTTTSINYKLPRRSFVMLTVYDLLGRELEILVSEEKETGVYNENWNADKFPSGVYITKIEAGDFTAFIKMILLK